MRRILTPKASKDSSAAPLNDMCSEKPSVGNPYAGFSGIILCYFIDFSIALAVKGDDGCYEC
ncbi:MAG TPA: hypothetical protein VFF14_00195, partial [Candidatus Deferrimicrobium sp.]|nr:hypothetical protein [Candidatus Deferrimicrobium sp.]